MPHQGHCLTLVVGPVALLCATGCSSFDRDFDAALAHGPYSRYDGAWEGTWESQVDGHNGGLRCLLSQTGVTEFRGRFQATYENIFPYEYAIPMTGTVEGSGMRFTGRVNLPFYGTYHWTGRIIGDDFTAEYKTERDQGIFILARPGHALAN